MKRHPKSFHRRKPMPAPAPGEIIINKNYCDGCGECVTNCPSNVLILKEITDEEFDKLTTMGKVKVWLKGKKKSFVNTIEACIFCGQCEENCHESAIAVGK